MGDKLQALEVRLKELTREMNRQYAFQSKVLTSLPDILSLYTKKELYHLATAYEIAGRSKMNKEELVRAVAAACCEPGNMKRNLLRLDKEQWAFFCGFFGLSAWWTMKFTLGITWKRVCMD